MAIKHLKKYLPVKALSYEHPRVLMYHMVTKHHPKKYLDNGDKAKNYLKVTPSEFEKQIQWLSTEGFQFKKMCDYQSKAKEKTVYITFDDGYTDNYQYAFETLKKFNAQATIYLVNNRFEKNWSTDRATKKVCYELNQQAMLDHQQVKVMIDSGLIEIGAHTLDHVRLHELEEQEAWQQINQSRKEIKELYSIDCLSFAYPFGFYDQQAIELVKKAGFTNATTIEDGVGSVDKQNSEFTLKRIMVSGRDDFRMFKNKIIRGARA